MMLHRLIIIARNDQFPRLSREADAQAAGLVRPTRSNAGRGDQASAGNEVRG